MDKIICIGSSSKDIFFPTNQGIILETPEDVTAQRKIAFELGAKYQVRERFEALGGCAANVACGLAKIGIDTKCYTKIGDDELGTWIQKKLMEDGIGTDAVQIEKGCGSDLSVIIVDTNTGERTIFSDRDANEKLTVAAEKLVGSQWFFVSSLNGNWQENLKKILEIAKEKNIRIAFNPGQKNIATDPAFITDSISHSELFMVNKDEAIGIISATGDFAADKLNDELFLLKTLRGFGAKVVVITDGVRGAWGIDDEEMLHAPALERKAVDTTGSGDAFTSGFLGAYLKEKSLSEALQWGIINSSNSVLFYGGQAGLLTKEEIEAMSVKVSVKSIIG